MGTKYEYQQLFQELTMYEKQGVRIKVDGQAASPMQVISAHLVKEEHAYMRDYVVNEDGLLKELCFFQIKEDN